MTHPFELRIEPADAVRCVVAVRGDLDIATAPHLRRAFARVADEGFRLVVVDLAGCSFVDSSGIGALVSGVRRLRPRGGDVAVVNVDGLVARTFELMRFDRIAPVYASRELALDAAA